MIFSSRCQGGVAVFTPQGRIDHVTSDAFSAALAPYLAECRAGGVPLVLDFSGTEYLSSVGLRALMLAARQVKAQNGRIAIAAPSLSLREVLQISRFNLVYQILDSVDAAVAGFST